MKLITKTFKTILLIAVLVSLSLVSHIILRPLLKHSLVPATLADDEEDEEDEDDEDEYETVYVKLPDTVVTTTKKIPRYDSDKDGMYDDEDPHPAINEFFIVKDENRNGIDDSYEQL